MSIIKAYAGGKYMGGIFFNTTKTSEEKFLIKSNLVNV